MATQMQVKVFVWQEIAWPPGLLERKSLKRKNPAARPGRRP